MFEVVLRRLLPFAIVIFFTVIRKGLDLSYISFKPFGFRIKVDQSPELLPISDGVMTWARYGSEIE